MLKLKVPPVVVFFVATGAQWVIHRRLPGFDIEFASQATMAISILSLAGFIGVASLWRFFKHRTTVNPHRPENTNSLVTGGIYRYSRNPMYLALAVGLAAPAVYLGNLLLLSIIPFFIWYMNEFQIEPEEEIMQEKFGREYEEYKTRVRRWI